MNYNVAGGGTTTGNSMVAFIQVKHGSFTSITMGSDTWVQVGSPQPDELFQYDILCYLDANCTGSLETITVAASSSPMIAAVVFEATGVLTPDVATGAKAGSSTYSSGSVTTNSATEEWFGAAQSYRAGVTLGLTGGTGFTNGTTINNSLSGNYVRFVAGHYEATATGSASYAGTLSPSSSWGAIVATFTSTGGGGGGSTTKTDTDSVTWGSETGNADILYVGSDTATFSESGSLNVLGTPSVDAATFAETGNIHATSSDTDFFTASSEIGQVGVLSTDTDSASFTESAGWFIGIQGKDTATFTEMAGVTIFTPPPPGVLTSFDPSICKPTVSPIYDGIGKTSNVAEIWWETRTREAARSASEWSVEASQVSAQVAVSWETLRRIHKLNLGFHYGLCSPVVAPINWEYQDILSAWRNDKRVSASKTVTWDNRHKRTAAKRIEWEYNAANATTVSADWNVFEAVHVIQPGASYRSSFGILRPVFYPISDSTVPSAGTTWNVHSRSSAKAKSKWNMYDKVSAQARATWNFPVTRPSMSKAVKWDVTRRLSSSRSARWNVTDRTHVDKTILWNTRFRHDYADTGTYPPYSGQVDFTIQRPVSSLGTYVDNASALASVKWDTRKRVSPAARMLWEETQRLDKRSVAAWKVITRESASRASKWELRKSVHTDGRVEWRFSTPVTKDGAAAWNVKQRRSASARMGWATVVRRSRSFNSEFAIFESVSQDAIIEWTVGAGFADRIYQTSVSRQDFAY